jgi:Chromo (CHRromatin Organisation MOdifier) domain
MTQLYAV